MIANDSEHSQDKDKDKDKIHTPLTPQGGEDHKSKKANAFGRNKCFFEKPRRKKRRKEEKRKKKKE